MAEMKGLLWAAGFLEADGWFGLNNGRPRIHAFQVERGPLQYLQDLFGGSIYPVSRKHKHPNWNDGYSWNLTGDKARQAMMVLRKHMRSSKRRQQMDGAIQSDLARLSPLRNLGLRTRFRGKVRKLTKPASNAGSVVDGRQAA